MSSNILEDLPRTTTRNILSKNKMGSFIVSLKKDTEKIDQSGDVKFSERRSSRLLKRTMLDSPDIKNNSSQNVNNDIKVDEQWNLFDSMENRTVRTTKIKRKSPLSSGSVEKKSSKNQKLAQSPKANSIDDTNTSKNNEELKKQRNKNVTKKKSHTVYWESKLTGARRVSKRLSKLEIKNKETNFQKILPENRNRLSRDKESYAKRKSTYEKTISRKKLCSGKTAYKRRISNKFHAASKVIRDRDIVEDEDIIISIKQSESQAKFPENKCDSKSELSEILLFDTNIILESQETTGIIENKECKQININKIETTTLDLENNIHDTKVDENDVSIERIEENNVGLENDQVLDEISVMIEPSTTEDFDLVKSRVVDTDCCAPMQVEVEISVETNSSSLAKNFAEGSNYKHLEITSENLETNPSSISAEENVDEIDLCIEENFEPDNVVSIVKELSNKDNQP